MEKLDFLNRKEDLYQILTYKDFLTSSVSAINVNLPDLYGDVPYMKRCVDLIVYSASTFPVAILNDKGEEVEPSGFLKDIIADLQTLYLDWILFGIAGGIYSPGKSIDLSSFSRIPANYIRYEVNANGPGSVRFYVDTKGGRKYLTHGENAFLFVNQDTDGKPLPYATSAGIPAYLFKEAMEVAIRFFSSGAIQPSILLLEKSFHMPETEQKKIKMWWRRNASGKDNAFDVVALTGVKDVKQLGSNPKDWFMKDVIEEARRSIAASLGVPVTLLEDAANYATAKEHRLSFYENTVKPIVSAFWKKVNDLLSGYGLQAILVPNDLEIYQQDEAEKAKSIVELFTNGIITLEEAREVLGWSPTPEGKEEKKEVQVSRKERRSLLFYELEKVRSKLKNTKDLSALDDFEFEYTPEPVILRLKWSKDYKEAIRRINAFLKAERKKKTVRELFIPLEKEVTGRLKKVFEKYKENMKKVILKGKPVQEELSKVFSELKLIFSGTVKQVLEEALNIYEADMLVFLEPEDVMAFVDDWSDTYIAERFNLIMTTTQKSLEKLQSEILSGEVEPASIEEEVLRRLEQIFGEARLERITITELTTAVSTSAEFYAKKMREYGVKVKERWITAGDEKVCPVCGPQDYKWIPEETESKRPPAHINCRCSVVIEEVKE